ncbi:MAG: PAS domain S-box-containing protein [Candidatus Azotimanducaceae bacterium]|jgi:PAS domain S-box-containing protein
MSAQPSQYLTTRLLIAEKSENAAHELDSTLRDAGIATKLIVSDDLAHIAQIVADGETDIVILTDKIDGLDTLLPRIHENSPHVPIVLLVDDTQENNPWTVAHALTLGATDLVPASRPEQLALVVQRELEHVCQRVHASQLRRALKEAEQRCQLLLQGSKTAIAYVHEGMHIHANEGYLNLFGYSELDDLCGASLVDLVAPDCADTLKQQLKSLRKGAEESVFEFSNSESCGDAFQGSMTLANAQYEGEDCLQVTVREQETNGKPSSLPTETIQQTKELGLPGFIRSAETLFTNHSSDAFIICLSIDAFLETQGAYGLLGAEVITRKVWMQIEEVAAEFPVVRLSPHQFAIAVTTEYREDINEFGERLRASIGEIILEVQDKTVRPTVSIAGALVDPDQGASVCLDSAYSQLLSLLDQGANTVQIATPDDDDDADTSNARLVLKQINDAIEKKLFVLLYQPVISLRGDNDEHYEVFLRMVGSEGQQIQPGKFLQTAIDNNVAGKIDRWVILQSIKMLSGHRAKGNTTRLTINLTANSVIDPEFPQWLAVAIKAARLPSDAVIFQVTERDSVTYLRQTREFVEKLRSMHCRASLSRFGNIDDPFETLRHIQVDMVKLDGECIENVESDSKKRELMMEYIGKLQGLGKLTVVPMVENANILSTLWQAGANYIQGHYLQEPTSDMDYDFSTEE